MHLPSHYLMHAHHLCGEYSVKTLYLSHCKSAQHKCLLILMRIPSMLTLWWMFDFWMGGVDLRIFALSIAAPHEKPKRQLPVEVL